MKQRTLQWAHRAPCSAVPNPLLAFRSCSADALQLWRQSGDKIPLSIRPKTPRVLLTQVSLRSSRNSRYRSWDLALREPALCCSIPALPDADNYGGTAAVKSRYLLAQRRRDVTQVFTGCNDNTYPDASVDGLGPAHRGTRPPRSMCCCCCSSDPQQCLTQHDIRATKGGGENQLPADAKTPRLHPFARNSRNKLPRHEATHAAMGT